MFILDSLMISGIRWALETALTAAEAEMNDDSVLREQLLEAEMRREMGEISDEEFADIEADLLARIREIKARRDGGGPIEMGAQPIETTAGSRFEVEATVSGDFYEPDDGRSERSERSDHAERSDRSMGSNRSLTPRTATPRTRTSRTTRTPRTTRAK